MVLARSKEQSNLYPKSIGNSWERTSAPSVQDDSPFSSGEQWRYSTPADDAVRSHRHENRGARVQPKEEQGIYGVFAPSLTNTHTLHHDGYESRSVNTSTLIFTEKVENSSIVQMTYHESFEH